MIELWMRLLPLADRKSKRKPEIGWALVKKYELGIGIDQIQLQNVNPPPPVQASFQ